MSAQNDTLNQYLFASGDHEEHQSLKVAEGAYKGWVPRAIYSKELYEVQLPFLRLLSFPVGGTALGSLSHKLTVFEAVGNYLTRLPACFAECHNLTKLNLGFNYFTEIPYPVYRLTRLEILNLEHNDLESMDSEIQNLKNLRVLNLSGNLLEELPKELRMCRRIQELHLSGKFYPGGKLTEFPECISYLTELRYLDLSWQHIGKIPRSIGKLRKLQVLNLKWNQLQKVSKELKKCARLKVVNLSGALRLLSAIPESLLELEDLEQLFLSDNFFTEVPQHVCGLVKLTQLVMQRNSLLRLSQDLYKLRYLRHLELSDNFLEVIPPKIKSLRKLEYLGLANNRLTELPEEICFLEQLTYLGLGNNKLTQLPENIYRLHNLRTLDVDNNELQDVPLLMDRLELLAEEDGLHILNNNLRSPFREISEQGTRALFEFLKGIRLKEAHHRWKMILIGAARAGKTSLRQALMHGRSRLAADSERTWVMERHLWEPESRLRVQILDFGGHHIYQAAHHMFLSSDALHVLVFDLTKYTSEDYEELIGHWLEAIMDRAGGAKIVIVGTHCDLCSKEDVNEKVEDIMRLMKRDETNKRRQIEYEIRMISEELDKPESREVSSGIPEIGIGRMQEKLNKLQKMLNSRSEIPERIFIVSAADTLEGIAEFRSSLILKLKSAPVSALPDVWFTFLEQIQQDREKVLTFEQTRDYFQQVMSDNQISQWGMGGSPERSLEMVLKYLHSTGEIVWYHDNDQLRGTVFHHPETLIDMLRAVFRHDFEDVVHYNQETATLIPLRESSFESMKKDFLSRGLLTKELLHYLLIHFKLCSDASDTFLNLIISVMLKFSLCFEFQNSARMALMGSAQVVQFPWFFPDEKPPNFELQWPLALPPNKYELCMEIVFSAQMPPNFFEKLSVKLHNFLLDANRINWKNGVLAQKNHSTLLVIRERKNDSMAIVIKARGDSDLQELWSLILNVRQASMNLFKDWPLLKCEIDLVCMHCVLKGVDDPHRYPGHVLEHMIPKGEYTLKCCEKFPDDSVPTCFVFPLEEDQENLELYLKAARDFMQKTIDSVDGPVTGANLALSDKGLNFIASNLGRNWTAVLLQLGVSQSLIEQLQISHQHDVHQQIMSALKRWRETDSDTTSPDDKLNSLFEVLTSESIGHIELVEKFKEHFKL
ncbi:unnamed protein product [Candidula unifasciata]|uniref:Malignant fibrous histiocytoma-amplified sequence 1 homolog n=1 Tax=Candidula unifasciata TaxID=100452 RepID=A0A8S3YQ22_9EUPU|nr:unnamed protein product [Candidula unifasciata]